MKTKFNVYQSEASDGIDVGGGAGATALDSQTSDKSTESDEEKELLRRSLANTKKDKAETQKERDEYKRELERLREVQNLLNNSNLSVEDIKAAQEKQKALIEKERQQQQIEEEYARRAAQKEAQHKSELEEIRVTASKRANELQQELERKDKYDAFADRYWKYGGVASEPHPITGKTKVQQLFDDIERNLQRIEDGNGYEAVDYRGQRVPTKDGSGFKDLDGFIADLAISPQYADFFNTAARNPVGGGYGMTPVGRGQNFPTGAGVISQKDFQSGNVDMAAVAAGRIKIRS